MGDDEGIKMTGRKNKKVEHVLIELTRSDLIHLRRFLNRGIQCASGKCPGYSLSHVHWLMDPIVKKIELSSKINFNTLSI